MATTTGVDLSVSGLASGFDWKAVITQLANAERSPETRWRAEQAKITTKNNTFDRVKTFLSTLQDDVQALKDPTLYASRTAATSDDKVATATADATARPGTYAFNITQLATAAKINGTANIGKALSTTSDVSTIKVADANFTTAVTAGTFTINGKTVTLATSDTLKQVFDKIAAATDNKVTATYDPLTDGFKLVNSDPGEIVLGSATDTSNFLQVSQLYNNASGTITSNSALGHVNRATSLINPAGQLEAEVASGFTTPITAGTFTVNGKSVTVSTGDTLQSVFSKIATATGSTVSASYNAAADKITLATADGTALTLGDGADTSNFLTAAQLASNAGGTATSTAALGGTHAHETTTGLATTLTHDATGAGQFSINGVTIDFNAGTDSLQDILNRINQSTAGVTAGYDSQNDRFTLTNNHTGDTGIVLSDVTGNFLAATGLAGSALTHGKNLTYTLNGGAELVSQGNTIAADSSSLTGITVSALTTGTTNVTIGNDNTKIKTAIQTFIKDYNTVQTYIGTQIASTTDATGKVTAGVLAGDQDTNRLIKELRSLSFAPLASLPGSMNQLADLGIDTNGKNNTIALGSSSKLDDALTDHLSEVQSLFADTTGGVAVKLDNFLTKTIGDEGTLVNHVTNLTKQSTSIDTQIANLEKTIATDSAAWAKAFQGMETAQAQITQQLAYLNKAFA